MFISGCPVVTATVRRQGSDFAVEDERDIGRSDYCVSIVVAPMGMPCFLHELVGVNGTRDMPSAWLKSFPRIVDS